MPRPPLPIGSWGKISRDQPSPGVHRAMCRFRDFDGVTRKVEARSTTGAKAERELIAKLQDRAAPAGQDIHSSMRVSALVPIWWAEFEDKDRAINTRRRYRETLDLHILPGVGSLRVRECTVSALDRFLKALRASSGDGAAKVAKSVLSGVLALAVRHGAMDSNPLRDVAPVPTKRSTVRALTVNEVVALRAGLAAWQSEEQPNRRHRRTTDLLDVVDLMLATGCRISEALALRWSDVNLGETPTVTIAGAVIVDPDRGVVLQDHPKSSGSRQTYRLPQFAVNMLLRRQIEQLEGNTYDVVFPSSTGTLRDPSNFRKQWRTARQALGFEWVTPQTFRKSVGTILANTQGLAAASRQLGHSNEQITAKHYVQRLAEAPDMSQVLEAFGGTR
ncbi:site-specific integrase [Micrococcus terreus]|uniref:site-specific integrase n=1 Tax=Micrococcus terreus TaxID=574650 RepID=UPI00254EBF8C|nr:site-specific integrase [Micrococcus terreus]MDK7701187.1 site-specific integrase [Micrococcus terreus]WOO97804.1 site-specific integrase [Micrococcus terreus]